MFTSAAVVITGVAPILSAISFESSFAPPKWPDKTLITKFALSSITITAGSVFLSLICGANNRITAPNENKQITPSLFLKSSTIFPLVESSYQLIFSSSFENFIGAKTSKFEKCSFNFKLISMPFFVIAKTAIFFILIEIEN